MSITFATGAQSASPVVVLTATDRDGDIRLSLSKDGATIDVLFISCTTGTFHRFALNSSQTATLLGWGFSLDSPYVAMD